ncbi:hypothetical protein GCM10022284_03550 [Streptomyces hundungensis]
MTPKSYGKPIATYRDWRGDRAFREAAYRKYEFPVHTQKVESRGKGERAEGR